MRWMVALGAIALQTAPGGAFTPGFVRRGPGLEVIQRARGLHAAQEDWARRSQPGSAIRWRTRTLQASGVTVAPPKPPKTTERVGGGGGEDGLRVISLEECYAGLEAYLHEAKRRNLKAEEWEELMEIIKGMKVWGSGLEQKRMGVKRLFLGNFLRGRLSAIAAVEVLWRGPNHDVRLFVNLLVVHPQYNKRAMGFETLDALKGFGRENALLLDLSPLMSVPSLRVFCLATFKTLDKDPEMNLQDPLVQKYKSRVRRSCYVLDNIPDWADLGPYWYEGTLSKDPLVNFYFRRRHITSVSEFEVTIDRPNAGVSTGSGTVGGARLITMEEADAALDVPGHSMVREVHDRLAARLIKEVQGENLQPPARGTSAGGSPGPRAPGTRPSDSDP